MRPTCSFTFVTTDPATAISGTKAYAGITGTLNVTISYAATLPFKNGKCNMNANPSACNRTGEWHGHGELRIIAISLVYSSILARTGPPLPGQSWMESVELCWRWDRHCIANRPPLGRTLTSVGLPPGHPCPYPRHTKLSRFLDHKLERSQLDVGAPAGSLSRSERCRRTAWHVVDCLLLVGSESDSAALASVQQGSCISSMDPVHNVSMIATPIPVKGSLRDRSPGVWHVRVSLGRDPASGRHRYTTTTVRGGRRKRRGRRRGW